MPLVFSFGQDTITPSPRALRKKKREETTLALTQNEKINDVHYEVGSRNH